jgi:acetyl-CoA acetyltransferase
VMHGRPMTIADYLAAPFLADPLRLLDSCLISDGGAAYVTTSLERARDLAQAPAVVAGVGEGYSASGGHWALQRAFTSTPQVFSAPGAFAMAGLRPADVDVLTVYDPFTVVSMMQIEDMGFCPKGEAGGFVEGDTLFHDSGKLPFNTHGGLLSHAYVLGIAHVVECVKQLRGVAAAQVPDCEVAVYGGYTGHMASTLVLTKDR